VVVYLFRRFGFIILTLFMASIVIFSATQLLPGDVAQVMLGQFATEQAVENLRAELGLNRPAYVQYFTWLGDFVTGDWGESMVARQPVKPMIMGRLANSSMLAAISFMIYVPLGILFGVIAALKREKIVDQVITGFSMAFVGLPEFVTGLLLISVFAFSWGILPANSSIRPNTSLWDALPYLVLPAIAVSLTNLGYIVRMTRASTIDVLDTDYVRAADLKGLPRMQVLIKHILRNSLLPTVTVVAMGIGYLIGGLIIVEAVFGYPGLGRLLVWGIQRRDIVLVQSCSMVMVVIFSMANLIADILYSILNPRIRYG